MRLRGKGKSANIAWQSRIDGPKGPNSAPRTYGLVTLMQWFKQGISIFTSIAPHVDAVDGAGGYAHDGLGWAHHSLQPPVLASWKCHTRPLSRNLVAEGNCIGITLRSICTPSATLNLHPIPTVLFACGLLNSLRNSSRNSTSPSLWGDWSPWDTTMNSNFR